MPRKGEPRERKQVEGGPRPQVGQGVTAEGPAQSVSSDVDMPHRTVVVTPALTLTETFELCTEMSVL